MEPFADLTNVLQGPHAPVAPPAIEQAQDVRAEHALLHDDFRKAAANYHGMPVRELMSLYKRELASLRDVPARILAKYNRGNFVDQKSLACADGLNPASPVRQTDEQLGTILATSSRVGLAAGKL